MISFYNVASGEEIQLDDPAMIAAFVNSSNMGKNSNAGQDFKWRISPELMAKVDEYSVDTTKLEEISKRLGVPFDALDVTHILSQIAHEENVLKQAQARAVENSPAHAEEYERRLAAAKSGKKPAVQVAKANTPKPKSEK